MNLRQGAILLVMFIGYLLAGGAIFMVFEDEIVLEEENPIYDALETFRDILLTNESLEVLGENGFNWRVHVNHIFYNLTNSEEYKVNKTLKKWNFYEATFFCLTVITTIGYGNKTPSNERSRGFCIVYALIGIPMTGIWMAGVGNYFSKKLLKAHEKTKNMSSRSPRLALIINTITYLIPGFVIFLILPAALFMALEEWTFLDSFYYSVITLTTIGFGDFVAGQGEDEFKWMYKILLMIWIIFGLGYLSMILNFIAKAMKSKHVKKLERAFTKNLKQTQEAFAKEVEYLVKSMNVYVNKIKKQEQATLERTNSCPSLNGSVSGQMFAAPTKTREQAESSANFIFDLAMAIACGELERDENGEVSTSHEENHNSNVAQLLTMALLPQLCGQGNGNVNTAIDISPHSTPAQSRRGLFDMFKSKNNEDDDDQPKPTKTMKSNSVVGNIMLPFGTAMANQRPRRQSEVVVTKSENVFTKGFRKQWESLSKELHSIHSSKEDLKQSRRSSVVDPTEKTQPQLPSNKRRHSAVPLAVIDEKSKTKPEKSKTTTTDTIKEETENSTKTLREIP
ncbi:Potassium channel sub K member 10 [Chamberlinius hualienensis]